MEYKKKEKLLKGLLGSYTFGFIVLLYLPLVIVFILSFNTETGGVTFPMNGFSFHWYAELFSKSNLGDLKGSLLRSLSLAIIVMAISTCLGTALAQAFRKPFRGMKLVFYTIMLGIIAPGIIVGLGTSLLSNALDISPAWYKTTLALHVVWTLPFTFLVMLAVFNHFDERVEEAAMDLGANKLTTFKEITLPLIMPGILSAALFGFTLSYDELPRSILVTGMDNTLPLDIYGSLTQKIRPTLYAFGTLTTFCSFLLLAVYGFLFKKTRHE